jgi:hypothetical protein
MGGDVVKRVLVWKFEEGPEDAPDEGSPDDAGPAWIDTYEGDEHISGEKVLDGQWITRGEAERMAHENGYEFAADDGSGTDDAFGQPTEELVAEMNHWLRASRFDDSISVELSGDRFLVRGPEVETPSGRVKPVAFASTFEELNALLIKHAPRGPSSGHRPG